MLTTNRTERKKTLGKLLVTFSESVNGGVRALEACRPKIAAGVVGRLAETIGDIEQVVATGDYPPSVSYEINRKLGELRSKRKYFVAAVRGGLAKEARTIGNWLKEYCDELAELFRIE